MTAMHLSSVPPLISLSWGALCQPLFAHWRALRLAFLLLCAGVLMSTAWADKDAVVTPLMQQLVDAEAHSRKDTEAALVQTIELLNRTAEFSVERLQAMVTLASIYVHYGKRDEVLRLTNNLDLWARNQSSPLASAMSMMLQAQWILSSKGGQAHHHKEGMSVPQADFLMTQAALLLPTDIPALAQWKFLMTQAQARSYTAARGQALEMYQKALALADGLRVAPWQSATRLQLAALLIELNQSNRAKSVLHEAQKIAEMQNDEIELAEIYLAYSNLHHRVGLSELQIKDTEKALQYARRSGLKHFEARYLIALVKIYLEQEEFEAALVQAEKAITLAREDADRDTLVQALFVAGLAHTRLTSIDKGRLYIEEAIRLNEAAGRTSAVASVYKVYGENLEAMGLHEDAIAALHQYRKLDKQIFYKEQQRSIVEAVERLDAQSKDKKIKLLRSEAKLQEEKIRSIQLQQYLVWLGLILGILILGLLWHLYRRMRSTNDALRQTNHQLRETTETDALTGLLNRRHIQRLIDRNSLSWYTGSSLVLLDIDHFKSINDTYGHAIGDAVLVEAARRMKKALREADILVRWGGEEFLIVALHLSARQAHSMAQRLLNALSNEPMLIQGYSLTVTASFGYATFPLIRHQHEGHWQDALALVDSVMYFAKRRGRNQAVGVEWLHLPAELPLSEVIKNIESAAQAGHLGLVFQGPAASYGQGLMAKVA
jgi:diguanylate cyclase (GGDEF)-like protein